MIELSNNLTNSTRKERAALSELFEREVKREKIHEAKMREIKLKEKQQEEEIEKEDITSEINDEEETDTNFFQLIGKTKSNKNKMKIF